MEENQTKKIWTEKRLNNFYKFRSMFYVERKMGFRSIWIPKTDKVSQEKLVSILKKKIPHYSGNLSDYFDVPEQTFITHHVSLTTQQREAIKTYVAVEADPMMRRAKQRIIENGCLYTYDIENINNKEDRMIKKTLTFSSEKIEYIKERAEEFDKLLVFANWTGQVHAIAKSLEDAGYMVYTLTGQSKNRAETIKMAENSSKCIVVAQCTISAGYELASIPCVIFASLNWQSLHHIQALGRVLRSNKLKKNLYIYLVVKEKGGSVDMDCYNAIMSGANFNEKVLE